MPPMESLRAPLAILLLALAVGVHAQVSGTLRMDSDRRVRGVSLSDRRPAAELTLNDDFSIDEARAGFAGLFVSSARFAAEDTDRVEASAYGGASTRMGPVSVDAGVQGITFTGARSYAYSEAFLGLTGRREGIRFFYSADYFHRHAHTLYTQAFAQQSLGPRWTAFLQAGALDILAADHPLNGARLQLDSRIGVSLREGRYGAQLSWVSIYRGVRAYPYGALGDEGPERHALVLQAEVRF